MKKQKKKLPVRAVGHYILVKPDDFEQVTASGIVTATDGQARREEVASVKGTIVSIGDIAWKDYIGGKPWAELGNRIWFKRHVSDEIKDYDDMVNGKPQTYFLMNDNNVLGVIEE